ncbi:MAG: single-stranded DNA-binding protein [bacterium]
MASANFVLLIGNLTADPEVRNAGGSSVSDLRLAVNDRYKNKAGEEVENTCFVDVTVWGQTAENCGKYLHKGSPVLVEGRLQYDQWEGKDGTKRSKLRVQASRVQFLNSRRDETSPAGDAGEAPPRSAPPAATAAEAQHNDEPAPF